MNNNVLLISITTLCESTEIPSNIPAAIISPLVKEIQEMYVEPVIGTKLYEKIKNDIFEGCLTSEYRILLDDYVKEVIAYGVLTDLPYKMNFRPTAIGFVARTSESANNNNEGDLQKISDYYRSRREFYANRLSSYLCANAAKYPEYKTESEIDEIRPANTQFETGIYLG